MFTEANRLRTFYNDRDEVVDSLANRFVDEYHVVCDRPSHDGAGSTKTELVPLQDRTQLLDSLLLEDSADAAEQSIKASYARGRVQSGWHDIHFLRKHARSHRKTVD